jgi:biofilm PGA synthesis N-glycosyltransferase PgaC
MTALSRVPARPAQTARSGLAAPAAQVLLKGQATLAPAAAAPYRASTIIARAAERGRQLLGMTPEPVLEVRTAQVATVIPAYNEQDTIADVLRSLLEQSRLPDVVYVIANNCDDATVDVAARFEGVHRRRIRGNDYACRIEVHDMGANADKKVGALNYGFGLASWADYLLGVDGDTLLDRNCVRDLELEMASDSRIGGISAIYDILYRQDAGPMETFLVAGQRKQFAEFEMDNLLSERRMTVLGGQTTLFRVDALRDVCRSKRIAEPWVRDSAVEDGLLTLWIAAEGYQTLISPTARAHVDSMPTLGALHHQQVKWVSGGADLMLRNPLHPNLRLRWRETTGMVTNIVTRLGFIVLLLAALDVHAFRFRPLWLIPPAVAVLLNLKIASTMQTRGWRDYLFAILAVPAEVYMWVRMSHFCAAWGKQLSKSGKDAWAAQARAERGGGGKDQLWPLIVTTSVLAGLAIGWRHLSGPDHSAILRIGWPVLFAVTITQTVIMARKVLRRTRGFKV